EVLELDAAHPLLLPEIEVAAVGYPLELGEALLAGEREGVLHVAAAPRVLCVVRQLVLGVVPQPEVLPGEAQRAPPVEARLAPVAVPEIGLARVYEELDLHQVELARAEDVVARRDLVAEGAADLADAEGHLDARRVEDVLEIDEHALRRLRPEVGLRFLVAHRTHPGLEHQIELSRLSQVTAAERAGESHLADARGRAGHDRQKRRHVVLGLRYAGDDSRIAHDGEARGQLLALRFRPALQLRAPRDVRVRNGARVAQVEHRLHPLALVEQLTDVIGAEELLALPA